MTMRKAFVVKLVMILQACSVGRSLMVNNPRLLARQRCTPKNRASNPFLFSLVRRVGNLHATNEQDHGKEDYEIFNEEDYEKTRVVMLRPEYGYRIIPFSWKELLRICVHEQSLSKLSRSVMQQYEYQLFMKHIRATYQSATDHILCSKFKFEKRYDEETRKYYAHPSLESIQESLSECYQIEVLPNDFPYYVENNIQHWVLWKLGSKICTDEEIADAKRLITERISPAVAVDFISWTNPPGLKSIPEIDHVHILCLLQRSDTE